jgi:hypothetical protein
MTAIAHSADVSIERYRKQAREPPPGEARTRCCFQQWISYLYFTIVYTIRELANYA